MLSSNGSVFAKAAGRALIAAVALGSLLVLMDASANYSGFGWRAAGPVGDASELEREVSAPGFAPLEFRLSGNWLLERARTLCTGEANAASESPNGDEALDNSCSGGATVNAVGDLPRTELLSWPDDWLYHRALHF